MKKGLIIFLIISVLVALTGCSNESADIAEESIIDYVDPSFIVNPEWLNENMDQDNVIILDAREEKAYKKGHIPGAINVAWQSFANMEGNPGDEGWGVVLDPQELSKAFAAIGVNKDSTVIAYSNNQDGWGEDGRFVWMLRMAGVSDSKILNGGFDLWQKKGFETSTEEPEVKPSNFVVEELDLDYIVDTDWIMANSSNIKIVDSRSEAEYNGATKYGEARGGHLPGAINLPFTSLFNENGSIKSQAELEALFSEAGINKDDTIVTYCTAGIRSAHLALVLKMAGYEDARNYDESFYRWAADGSLSLE